MHMPLKLASTICATHTYVQLTPALAPHPICVNRLALPMQVAARMQVHAIPALMTP